MLSKLSPRSPIRDGRISQFSLYFLLFFLCHFIFLYFPQLLVVIVAQTLSSPISYCRLATLPTHHFHKIKGENINVKQRQNISKIKDNSDASQDALRGFPNISNYSLHAHLSRNVWHAVGEHFLFGQEIWFREKKLDHVVLGISDPG